MTTTPTGPIAEERSQLIARNDTSAGAGASASTTATPRQRLILVNTDVSGSAFIRRAKLAAVVALRQDT